MQCFPTIIHAALCGMLAAPATVQDVDATGDRYIVRRVDENVLLIDVETGWTWKRIGLNKEKAPRWRQVPRFKNADEVQAWLARNPVTVELDQADTARWANEILFGLENQNASASPMVIRRWVTSPTVSVAKGSREHHKLVQAAVKRINDTLKPTTRIKLKLLEPGEDAAIRVHFMQFSEFPAFCRANNLPFSPIDHGCFYTNWDNKYRITDADVLIAIDQSYGDGLKHLVLEELTQSLGPMNDSAFKRDSIFFSGRSAVTDFSKEDKRLLQSLYSRLKAGDKPTRARSVIRSIASPK